MWFAKHRCSILQHMLGGPQGMTIDWKPPGSPSSFLVKRVLRLDIPVDRYPNVSLWNSLLFFVDRLMITKFDKLFLDDSSILWEDS